MLDTEVARWWSVDPKANELPWQSVYNSMDGNPIGNTDVLGDKVRYKGKGARRDARQAAKVDETWAQELEAMKHSEEVYTLINTKTYKKKGKIVYDGVKAGTLTGKKEVVAKNQEFRTFKGKTRDLDVLYSSSGVERHKVGKSRSNIDLPGDMRDVKENGYEAHQQKMDRRASFSRAVGKVLYILQGPGTLGYSQDPEPIHPSIIIKAEQRAKEKGNL
ncbi:hypothetical protein KFE98_01590 [bacterium SCSIO 12741]|nr:hypothetical protein KFE98_01590 [bacterium SCSIO 12741]